METLDYERVIDIDTGDTLGYYSEGHVSKEQFAYTILEEEEEEISIDNIFHGYMKQSPLDEEDCNVYAQFRLDFRRTLRIAWTPVTFCGDI